MKKCYDRLFAGDGAWSNFDAVVHSEKQIGYVASSSELYDW